MNDLTHQRQAREWNAKRTAIWGVLYHAVYAFAQLIGLGMIVRYVGGEQYGLWMTIVALTAWVPLVGVGQPSTLLTKLGAVALTDMPAASRLLSSSLILVWTLAAVLLLLLTLVGPLIPWAQLLNATGYSTRVNAGATATTALAVMLITVPAMLGPFAVFAHQRGDIVHIVMIAGSLGAVGLAWLLIELGQPLSIVGAASIAGSLAGSVGLWSIGRRRRLIPPVQLALVNRDALREMASAGVYFLLIDAATLLVLRTPELIVARLYGVEAVGPFASVGRLPLLMLALFQAVLLPYWPALGEAAHRRDGEWIRQIARRSFNLVIGLWTIGALAIWFLGAPFIEMWTGSPQFATSELIAAACGQSLGLALLAWFSVLLGALSLQRLQVIALSVVAAMFVPLALICGAWLGPAGVAFAQAAALLFGAFPMGAALAFDGRMQRRPAPNAR